MITPRTSKKESGDSVVRILETALEFRFGRGGMKNSHLNQSREVAKIPETTQMSKVYQINNPHNRMNSEVQTVIFKK